MTLPRFPWSRLALAAAALPALATIPARAQDRIIVDGATGGLPLARSLIDAYRRRYPSDQIEVGTGLSTSARLRALAEGTIQIAVASHGITPETIREGNLTVVPVARGAVVFAVNQTVTLTDITEQQLCDIYSGRTTTWKPLGGSDSPVAVLTRPASEVDPEVIRAGIACFSELQQVATALVMAGGGDMARALAQTPHALGMTSLTVVTQSDGKVKVLSLAGVQPTPDNVKNGRYRLTREFLFVVKGEPAGLTRKFLDFVRSPEGDRVILANGAAPVR